MDEAVGVLAGGELISLFPEGTRNRSEALLLPFKYGAVTMAKRSGVPVIPFALTGRYRLFRRGIQIEFGAPLDLSSLETGEANALLQERVAELIYKSL